MVFGTQTSDQLKSLALKSLIKLAQIKHIHILNTAAHCHLLVIIENWILQKPESMSEIPFHIQHITSNKYQYHAHLSGRGSS